MSIGTGSGAADPELSPRKPPRPSKKWKLTVVGILSIYAVLGVYGVVTNADQIGTSSPIRGATAMSSRTVAPSPSLVKHASPQPTQANRRATSSAAYPLGVTAIAAFGPEGTSDGDNPGIAYRIFDTDTEQPWYSQWYATPSFGGLRTGTGLLLDMGKTVTVRDVRLVLGSAPGADVQVRVGNTARQADLTTVATATDAGGNVQLTLTAPAGCRYVLIWFTRLPPDGHGHYQVSVYNVMVDG